MYRNGADFCILILYPPISFIRSNSFPLVESVLPLSFQFGFLLFIYFPCLITVTKISNHMFYKSDASGYPCLIPDLRGNAVSPHHWKYLLWVCYIWPLLCWRRFPLCYFWRLFIINVCWIFLKALSASIEMIIWFLFFSLLIRCITLIDLHILKNLCI